MNLFCKVSWTSWYNSRRIIESLYNLEKSVNDFSYTVLSIYASGIIAIYIVDYYGTFWPKRALLGNGLLANLLGIDIIIITADLLKNLYYACVINELYSIQKFIITEYLLFLKYLKNHLEYFLGDEEQDLG